MCNIYKICKLIISLIHSLIEAVIPGNTPSEKDGFSVSDDNESGTNTVQQQQDREVKALEDTEHSTDPGALIVNVTDTTEDIDSATVDGFTSTLLTIPTSQDGAPIVNVTDTTEDIDSDTVDGFTSTSLIIPTSQDGAPIVNVTDTTEDIDSDTVDGFTSTSLIIPTSQDGAPIVNVTDTTEDIDSDTVDGFTSTSLIIPTGQDGAHIVNVTDTTEDIDSATVDGFIYMALIIPTGQDQGTHTMKDTVSLDEITIKIVECGDHLVFQDDPKSDISESDQPTGQVAKAELNDLIMPSSLAIAYDNHRNSYKATSNDPVLLEIFGEPVDIEIAFSLPSPSKAKIFSRQSQPTPILIHHPGSSNFLRFHWTTITMPSHHQ